MRHVLCIVSAVALAGTIMGCRHVRSSGADSEAKPAAAVARDDIPARSDVLRYYTFDSVTPEAPVCPSLAGEDKPLLHGGGDTLEVVPGRFPDSKAVRLDEDWFASEPFAVDDRQFTAECWIRKHGQGKRLGNGRTCGMVMAQGCGYWTGWRIMTPYPARTLRFAIGRPKPSHSFAIQSNMSVPDGVWHHLAVSWDGELMRLYVDGWLAAANAYSGAYSPPSSDSGGKGEFRVGFANAGVGSLRMDVDEVAVYNRALPERDIVRHAFVGMSVRPAFIEATVAANVALATQQFDVAISGLQGFLSESEQGGLEEGLSKLLLGRLLSMNGRQSEAVGAFAEGLRNEKVPVKFLLNATANRLALREGVSQADAPSHVLRSLLDSAPPSAERLPLLCSLAASLCRENRSAEAIELLTKALRGPVAPDLQLRMTLGRCQAMAGNHAAAIAEFAAVKHCTDLNGTQRALAAICLADCLARAGKPSAAIAEFAGVAALPGVPEHLIVEGKGRADELKREAAGLPGYDAAMSRTALPSLPKPGVVIHVATDGSDENPGTRFRPLATLTGARDAVRALRSENGRLPAGGVTVLVHRGVYPIRSSVELTAGDSGTADCPIVYRSASGTMPIFRGGVSLTSFEQVRDDAILSRLPERARPYVRVVDLKAHGVSDCGEFVSRGFGISPDNRRWIDLYSGERRLRLARWPNSDYCRVGAVHQGVFKADKANPPVFDCRDERPLTWQAGPDIWVWGFWAFDWEGRLLGVERIDAGSRRIVTRHRSCYGAKEGMRYYFLNVLEELDQPGEWVLDRASGKVYVWPEVSRWRRLRLDFPVLSSPFIRAADVRHVEFRNLAFDLGQGMGIRAMGCDHIRILGCRISRLGGCGISMRGTHNAVMGCDILRMGGSGVRMEGGDQPTLTPGHNVIENNHIGGFTLVDRVYAPAVWTSGVGTRVAHNLLHDSPHHAMRVEGSEHIIELNDIHSVVWEADDQSGIDIFGNAAYRGIVIRWNFWHHIGSGRTVAGQAGIRLDDAISGVLMVGNVFYRASDGRFGAIQIHGGKDNICDNNLMFDCRSAFSFSPWGEGGWKAKWERGIGAKTMLLKPDQPPYSTRYPDLAHLHTVFDVNTLTRNLVVDCGRFALRAPGRNRMHENLVWSGADAFADIAARDFSLARASGLARFAVGFRPIPIADIGLYESGSRASWPVESVISDHFQRY